MVPIDLIDPNPNQPRQVMGDLSELMASIAEKGIIEPLVLRQRGERYQIIAGERRYQAAVQVGLRELPGVIREGDDNEVLEVALVENLQRKDLTRVRRVRGDAGAGPALRLHARDAGEEAGEVAGGGYGVPGAARHARRGQKPMSAGRHYL